MISNNETAMDNINEKYIKNFVTGVWAKPDGEDTNMMR